MLTGTDEKLPEHLEYVPDHEPGIMRKRRGKGFIYEDANHKKVNDTKTLKRIESLVIPPMWDNVWICPNENGYLQSTGVDQKNRKQYIYHPAWVAYQQQSKYDRLAAFGKSLCKIRDRIQRDIRLKGWPKTKVVALTVDLLDHYLFRIGNERYATENQSYGLTTLRRKHLQDTGDALVLSFKAKSGIYRTVKIRDRRTTKLIRQISELPGYEIFRYLDNEGMSHKIDSHDVNQYIKEISGADFSAKDFRTWGGTKLVLHALPKVRDAMQNNPKLKLETQLVKAVATMLGNTVSVCRSYYIHPKVLEYVLEVELDDYERGLKAAERLKRWPQLDAHEKMLLKILSD